MTGLVGALAEAWAEVRVHRVRVVLSLVGVVLAVFAMTTATALGQMGSQAVTEAVERESGRAATLSVSVSAGTGPVDAGATTAAFRAATERYDIRWSWVVGEQQAVARFPSGARDVQLQVVDADYGTLHRVLPDAGRWFTDADTARYAPALVVNRAFADLLGGFDPAAPSTVVLGGPTPVRATVVGVAGVGYSDDTPAAYALAGPAARWAGPPDYARYEVWVPPEQEDAVTGALVRDLSAGRPGTEVSVFRADAQELDGVRTVLAWAIRAVGLFGLGLGALGVVNVGLVTVRQRVREIGVRRSFGATSGRVFATVLLESVVATAAAGALAVALSIALVQNLPLDLVRDQLSLTDVPPYPVRAAVEGFVAAVAVGALAGLVPATVAVRVRVIDAIRY